MDKTAHQAPLDIDAAALYIGVTLPFMRRMIRERRIAYLKIGRYVRFDPADLDAFVAAGRVETKANT